MKTGATKAQRAVNQKTHGKRQVPGTVIYRCIQLPTPVVVVKLDTKCQGSRIIIMDDVRSSTLGS
jgi:hypothetical protein